MNLIRFGPARSGEARSAWAGFGKVKVWYYA